MGWFSDATFAAIDFTAATSIGRMTMPSINLSQPISLSCNVPRPGVDISSPVFIELGGARLAKAGESRSVLPEGWMTCPSVNDLAWLRLACEPAPIVPSLAPEARPLSRSAEVDSVAPDSN